MSQKRDYSTDFWFWLLVMFIILVVFLALAVEEVRGQEWRAEVGVAYTTYRDLGTDPGIGASTLVEWRPRQWLAVGATAGAGQLRKQCTGCDGVLQVGAGGHLRLGHPLFIHLGGGYSDADNGGVYHKSGASWTAGAGYRFTGVGFWSGALAGGEAGITYTDVDDRFNDVTAWEAAALIPLGAAGGTWFASLAYRLVQFTDPRYGRIDGDTLAIGVRWRGGW